MNIRTDIELTYAGLNRTEWQVIQRIAREGTEEQRDTLLAWAHTEIPAIMYEDLCELCERAYMLDA